MKVIECLTLLVVTCLIVSSVGVALGRTFRTDQETSDDLISVPGSDGDAEISNHILSEDLQENWDTICKNETVEVVIRFDPYGYNEDEEITENDLANQGKEFVKELKDYSEKSQRAVRDFVNKIDGEIINTFWIANAVFAEVDYGDLNKLATFDNVWRIHENFEVEIYETHKHEIDPLSREDGGRWDDLIGYGSETIDRHTDQSVRSEDDLTWGLDRINVTDVWEAGRDGTGVRVAVSDTGVDMEHPDLEGRMSTVDEDDPHYPGGWIEIDEVGHIVEDSTPYDSQYHGTHCSGTVLGGNSSGKSIGVAPGAELMHALTLPEGGASFTQLIKGLEWKVEPFDRHGDPLHEKYGGNVTDFRPHVASMSWGAAGYRDEFEEPIQKLRDAGVVPVVSIGNYGQGTVGTPGAIYESFGIGASDRNDEIAGFSSGGIVEDDRYDTPEEYVKPDFVAPGIDVLSSIPEEDYNELSGTSMAAPHVAGTIALLYETHLSVDDIYKILEESSDYHEAGESLNESKNTRYGYGIIDASKALDNVSYHINIKDVEGITNESAVLRGELLEMVDEEVEVFFRYRREGEYNWSTTEKQSLNETGVFEYKIEGLEKATDYEYKALGNWTEEQNTTLTRTFTTHRDVEIVTLPEEDLTHENATIRSEVLGIYLDKAQISFRFRKLGEDWEYIEMGNITEPQVLRTEVEGLKNFTSYEYQAFAEADGKEFFGDVFRLTTKAPEPEWDYDREAYLINSASELQWMRNDLGTDYILEDDIDASETREWYAGKGFRPIEDGFRPFSGSFDGNGSTIEGLYINRSEKENVGLFGITDKEAEIRDIDLNRVNITGGIYVGGLVGYNGGLVTDSNVSGKVNGQGYVGGLAGINHLSGLIEQSFSSATVEGEVYVGGLVGINDDANVSSSFTNGEVKYFGFGIAAGGLIGMNFEGRLNDSYSYSEVSGLGMYIGGLVGANYYDSYIENSYAEGRLSGARYMGGLVGLNSGILNDSFAAVDIIGDQYLGGLMGFNEGGSISNSYYNIDEVSINDERLITIGGLFQGQYDDWIKDKELDIADYEDSLAPSVDHYEISGIQGLRDLLGFAGRDDYKFRLTEDIDLSDEPGLYIPYLEADFHGNEHVISNLTIEQTFNSKLGMFGYAYETKIENVRLEDIEITGSEDVGGLIGYNFESNVSKLSTSGSVVGDRNIGGLIGFNYGYVENSFSTASVIGDTFFAGGLMGSNFGTIERSYATGSVDGHRVVGGLVGESFGMISGSYSIGEVRGFYTLGGLVGDGMDYMVENSFWDFKTAGIRRSEGGKGMPTERMIMKETFTEADWDLDEEWDMIEKQTYPFLRWQDEDTYPTPPKAVFEVDISDYDEKVGKGAETLIEYEVRNIEDIEGTQTVEFLVDGELEDTAEVELGVEGFELWNHSIHSRVVYSVNEGDGVIYSGSGDGRVLAFDAENEEELWVHDEHEEGVTSVHYEDGVVYSGSNDYTVMAYDVESQEKLWAHAEHDMQIASIYAEDGVVYSGCLDGTVIAYDVEQEKLWMHEEQDNGVLSIHVEDGIVYSGGLDGSVVAYNSEEQRSIWEHREHDYDVWSVYYYNGVVYSGSSDNTVVAFDTFTRSKIWSHGEHYNTVESVYVDEGIVYSGSWEGTVMAYDPEFHEPIWEHEKHDEAVMSVHAEEGVVYSGSLDGSVIAYSIGDIYDGEFTWDTSDKEIGEYDLAISSEDDEDIVTVKVLDGVDLDIQESIGNGEIHVDGKLIEHLPWTEVFLEDDEVTLEAFPDVNWEFDKWEIEGTTNEDRDIRITMNQDKDVTAHFTPKTYPLVTDTLGEGSVQVEPYKEEYEHGEKVNLTAVPDEGYDFVGWSGDYDSTSDRVTLIIDDHKELIAHFEIKTYTLNVSADGEGSVEIDPDKDEYEHGEKVELTAVPDEGYGLYRWSGYYEGEEEHITLVMDNYKDISAHFLEESNFEVEIRSHSDEIVEGEELIVKFTVTNEGELEDTQEIELLIDDKIRETKNVTLGSGKEYQGEFIWIPDESGEYSISVSSDDHEVTSAESVVVEKEFPTLSVLLFIVIGAVIVVVLGANKYSRKGETLSDDEYHDILNHFDDDFDKELEDMDKELDKKLEEIEEIIFDEDI